MKSRFKIKHAFIWAIALTAIDFIVASLTFEMAYLSNDDGGIQSALSGTFTGEPYPFHQFINVLLGYPLSWLYRIIPEIQWWYIWSLALVAVGIFLVHYFLLKMASKNNYSIPIVLGILIFVDVGFFIYPIANISFTIVPAILGTGIVAGWLYLAEAEEVKHEKLLYILTIVGYMVLFCHRRQTGIVLLCFILLAFLYYYVTRSENWKKAAIRFLITAAIFIAISGTLTAVNRTIQNNLNGEEFVSFNSARSQFIDYPHDSYDEDPELYAEIDWDRDIYYLASDWCFIPDNVNTENLSYISEHSNYTATDKIDILKSLYHDARCVAILLLFAASIVIALFIVIVRFNKKVFIFLLLNNIGAIGLFVYQILTGRAMYRSIIILLLPAVVINVILSFRQELDGKALRNVFYIIAIALGLICVVPMLTATFSRGHNESVLSKKIKQNAVDRYLVEHSENFYVIQTGATDNIDPGRRINGATNNISWGGSTYYSDLYYEELKANGLSELTGETFENDNVYLICTANAMAEFYYDSPDGTDRFAMFYRYLKNNYGAIGFVQEDKITDGAYVYHFVFEDNAGEYEDYYDLVDGYTMLVE